ncbi:helix-turn-helix domain-containing protein [Dysgonomonas reticulitermitis]
MDKKDIEFWVFLPDSPELYQFYLDHISDNSIYYAVYIEKYTREVSPETKEVLYLRNNSILLVDSYLIPLFCHLHIKGYVIIISMAFFESNEYRILLKLLFFHNQPTGIIDLGYINESQKECIDMLYKEYCSPYDKLQVSILRNLVVNLFLLSSTANYEGQLKSGHLLNYALQFSELVNDYAFFEKGKRFYADKIGITEKALDKSLQFIYHKTFKEILANRILIEAMKLLVFSDKTITQIAHELGYDASNFIKFFSLRKRIHPKDLRIDYRKILNEIENGYR